MKMTLSTRQLDCVNGELKVHSSLLNAVLHDEQQEFRSACQI